MLSANINVMVNTEEHKYFSFIYFLHFTRNSRHL